MEYYIVDEDLNIIDAVPADYANKMNVAARLAKEIKHSLDLQKAYKKRTVESDPWFESQMILNEYYYKMFACELLD